MKKTCTYVILFTLLWLIITGTVLKQEKLSSQLIRIHVLANSDSPEDQAVKLDVRDAVLEEVTALTEGCSSRREAAQILRASAEQLGKTAAKVAEKPVTVCLSPEWYETRDYGSFALPAGKYLSLQIGVGAAEGKNWWCVAFPTICTAATAESFETTVISAGFDSDEVRMMTDDGADIRVRFMLLELLSRIRAMLRG